MNIKLKRHAYTSNGEKIKHFFYGLFGWVIVGILLFFQLPVHNMNDLFWILGLIFISLFTYFTITKYWAAIGLMANILINLILTLLFGIKFTFDIGIYLLQPFPLQFVFGGQ